MADSAMPRTPLPSNWNDAFAALPLEAPPQDHWSVIARGLHPAPPVRPRIGRRSWWAVAAMLGAIATSVAVFRPGAMRPAAQVAAATKATIEGDVSTPAVPAPSGIAAPRTAAVSDRRSPPPRMHKHTPAATVQPSTSAHALASSRVPDKATRESRSSVARIPTDTRHADPTPATVAAVPSLQSLREESARLEALVTLARDDRMASAPAVVLAADAEDRVRMLDAALSRPGLGDAEQLDLWTRRVAALRELAGVEGTNRWLAANGESLQGAVALVD